MSQENKAIFSRFVEEIWNKGNLTVVDELIAPDFVLHSVARDIKGPEGFKQYLNTARMAFPDIHFTREDSIAEREKVVTRWTMTGTHKGEFMGIPGTGKSFAVPGTSISHIVGGKLKENWVYWDRFGLLEQLGVAPKKG